VGESPSYTNFNKPGHPQGWCIQKVLEECLWRYSNVEAWRCNEVDRAIRRGIGSSVLVNRPMCLGCLSGEARVQQCTSTSLFVSRRCSRQPSLWHSRRFFDLRVLEECLWDGCIIMC
jgi:hypothetical protein